MSLILGLESSCDETAAAVVADGCAIRSSIIASQNDLHAKYGGVVPEIASRAHLERIDPVVHEALSAAGVTLRELDAIAVGNRPGLIGSLLVGVSAAKALAWALHKPLIGVDHVRAHLYAAAMTASFEFRVSSFELQQQEHSDSATRNSKLETRNLYPALGLVVSGGHTSLYELASPTEMTLLGRTIDDAVGEAYDKAAVILQVGYPGGPKLDKLAQSAGSVPAAASLPGAPRRGLPPSTAPSPAPSRRAGRSPHPWPREDDLPISLLGPDSLDFSFSGLKTALLYKVRGLPRGRGAQATFARSAADLSDPRRAELAAAFQHAAIGTLVAKLDRALEHLATAGRPPRSLLIGGGVSANSLLRQRALALGEARGLRVCLPPLALCLDNAAMIAGLAHEYFRAGQFDDLYLPALATTGR